MFKPINQNLTDLLQQKSTCKRASCRTYASSLVKIWREMTNLDRSQMPTNFKWVDTAKTAAPVPGHFWERSGRHFKAVWTDKMDMEKPSTGLARPCLVPFAICKKRSWKWH